MTSNEHGAIEQNVEHHEANKSTYYTHESELHARSYDAESMAEILICRPLCELEALTTEQCMTNQAYLQQDGMFMKLTMARTNA